MKWTRYAVLDSNYKIQIYVDGRGGHGLLKHLSKQYGISMPEVEEIVREAERIYGVKITIWNEATTKKEIKSITKKLEQAIEFIERRCEAESLKDWLWENAVYDREKKRFVKA